MLLSLRRRWTESAMTSIAVSTSSAVLNRPSPNRRLPRTRSSGRPKARSTWLGCGIGRGAGAAGTDGQAILHVQQQCLPFDVAEVEIQISRQPRFRLIERGSVESDVIQSLAQAGIKSITQFGQARLLARHFFDAQLQGPRETDDAWHVGGAAAKAVFLTAAEDLRLEFHERQPAAARTSADAFGAINFVGREAEQIDM